MIFAGTLRGIEGRVVEVTAVIAPKALPSFAIKGLSEAAQREARVRVQASLANARIDVAGRIDVVLDARGAPIDGTSLDLAIALVIAGGGAVADIGAVGELSLGGDVRPVRGVLPIVEALRSRVSVVLVAPENALEAALVEGVRVVPVCTLAEALDYARGAVELPKPVAITPPAPAAPQFPPDMSDVRGQPRARRALEIAAAGGHHVMLVGGPGSGKTMLARRLVGILPPMTHEEALEVTRVHSAAGLNVGGSLARQRPFRAPHHSTTPPGLVGGGSAVPRPGEVTLAHNGVLFLDELPEFSRVALEVLDDPIATCEVVLARATGTLRFPARPILVASLPPCPCGRLLRTRAGPQCRCEPSARERYLARVPARLLRRLDLRVVVDELDLQAIEDAPPTEASAPIRERVTAARARLRACEKVSWEASRARPLARAADAAGTYERALRVARTIAALDCSASVKKEHVEEALTFTRDLADLVTR